MLQRESRADAGRSVPLSVVIPVYNAASDLERCLTALEASSYPDWEAVVVDDGSTDGSGEVARRHGAQLLILNENGGQARARNRGAVVARGPVLLFIDADVYVHADTLAAVVAAFAADANLPALMGSYDDRPAAPSFLSQYKNLFHHYVHQRGRAEASTFWSGCGAIRRSLFLAMGGFNEEFRAIEDIELGFRLRQAGHRIRLENQIQATHGKRWRFWNLLATDLFRRGVPWVALMIRDRRMTCDLNLGWRDRCCAALTYMLAGCIAFTVIAHGITPRAGWLPLALFAAILALQLDFYRFFLRRRGGLFALGVLPMHLLYYLYSGAAIPLGAMAYLAEQWRGSRSGARLVGKGGRLARAWSTDAPARAENLAPVAVDRDSA
jgi:glycosyltransferase involved in cell wall biosynthesis